MENFTYSLPTKIVFGKDQIKTLKSLLEENGVKKVLLVYGKRSIKKLGIYDEIVATLNAMNILFYEESGVKPNPDITSVKRGQKTLKENDIDFILAAGGGSVIDAAKAMAFAYYLDGPDDIWDVFMRKQSFDKALPLGTILTLAATGTETNGNTVISNEHLQDKRSVASQKLVPVFSIIDPSYTLSVNRHHTIAGAIDIIMHVFEQYFSPTKRTETSDYMSFAIIKSVIENTRNILKDEDSYETRANISWAATIALSWLLQQGKTGDWASHRLSYPITVDYGITHGYALAIIQPAWMQVVLKHNPEAMGGRLRKIGEELFGISEPEEVIEAFKQLFNEFGAATTFKQDGVQLGEEDIERMATTVLELGEVGNMVKIDHILAKEVFDAAK